MTEVLHVQKVSGISGSERHLLSVLPLLRERGWDIRMVVLHGGEPGAAEFVRELDVPTESWRMRADVDPAIFARLVARARGVPIVHAHLVHAHFHALPAALVARVPVRVAHHHGFNEFRERRFFAAADRLVERCATRHVAISSGLARYLSGTEGLRAPFEIVHYGIAAAPEGVSFLGHVAPAGPVLERAAVVVVPSRGEGFGMVALEAAERGRAVVAARVGGLPEIVADGETGLLVPSEDEEALAQAIVALISDPERVRRLGAAARRRALEAFPESSPADELDRLYRVWLGDRLGEDAAVTGRR